MTGLIWIYDEEDGSPPVFCTNRKYMGGKVLSSSQRCKGCEWEIHDLFTGTSGKEIWQWYCTFSGDGGGLNR